MPAGSNPSWLSAGQFAAVLDRVGRGRPGTMDRVTPNRLRWGALAWLLTLQFFVLEALAQARYEGAYSRADDVISALGAADSAGRQLMNASFVVQAALILAGALLLRPVLLRGAGAGGPGPPGAAALGRPPRRRLPDRRQRRRCTRIGAGPLPRGRRPGPDRAGLRRPAPVGGARDDAGAARAGRHRRDRVLPDRRHAVPGRGRHRAGRGLPPADRPGAGRRGAVADGPPAGAAGTAAADRPDRRAERERARAEKASPRPGAGRRAGGRRPAHGRPRPVDDDGRARRPVGAATRPARPRADRSGRLEPQHVADRTPAADRRGRASPAGSPCAAASAGARPATAGTAAASGSPASPAPG